MEVKKLTSSEIRNWKRCRRKWWLANVRQLTTKQEKKYGALSIGTRVHQALDVYYSHGYDADLMMAQHEASVEADVAECPEQEAEIRKDADLSRAMLEGYPQWLEEEAADEDLEVVALEEAIEVPFWDVNGFSVWLLGKLDQRIKKISTGVRLFLDHKTVDNFSRVRLLPLDEQMKHYHLLERLSPDHKERTDGGLYNMLRKVKRTSRANPPFYMRQEVRHNDAALDSYWERMIETATEITRAQRRLEDGEDHRAVAYPNPTRDCAWDCPFLAVCPMLDDGSDAEGMIELTFDVRDHLSRYSTIDSQEVL